VLFEIPEEKEPSIFNGGADNEFFMMAQSETGDDLQQNQNGSQGDYPYSDQDVLEMKDQMIAYLRNEKRKLELELLKQEYQRPAFQSQPKRFTAHSINFTLVQLVTISLLALFLGYTVGSR